MTKIDQKAASGAARLLTRRAALKVGAAAGAAALAGPMIVRNAFSSSGELNFMGWSGYDFKAAFAAFTKATGIEVKFVEQPDQDSMMAQAKLSLQTGGIDVVEPTLERTSAWNSNGLIQAWDTGKLSLDNYIAGLADGAAGERATIGGKRFFVPSVWGTEALVYSKTEAPTEYGKASLGDLWDDKFVGKV